MDATLYIQDWGAKCKMKSIGEKNRQSEYISTMSTNRKYYGSFVSEMSVSLL